ncbi:unnamed protein product [Chrysodeixis includens]|uniref:Major facilitator superfamily (MFS) profile domain-containing protein n=1 Tax=Chrysodeixis includens TaxID=689277 RepID=A0A9P0BV83_CHRIL|nr:unnamed protein product [Chrysodeixis includens]
MLIIMSEPEVKRGLPWIYFLRQLFICSGIWSCLFFMGLCMGSPTIIIPQLRREVNSTDAVSKEMASWLSSAFSYSGVPWSIIIPISITTVGRKITQTIVCVFSFIGFIILYTSSSVYLILISEICQGALFASFLTILVIVITEYSSSQYRGMFLTIKSATFFWGVLISNAIGTFYHWRNIAILGLICSAFSLLSILVWPESPLWLAKKRRFDECKKAHRWLKGCDVDSEKELEKIIANHQNVYKKSSIRTEVLESIKILNKIEFYKPILLSLLVLSLYTFSGKLVCTLYAIDIIKQITKSESTAYTGMLILDAVTVCTMYVGCALSKTLKRRTLLLTSSSIAILFMLVLSLYTYLVKLSIVAEEKHLSIALLVGYSVAIGSGPMILSTSITGELIPLQSRSLSMTIIALFFKFTQGTFVKVSPYFFDYFDTHGAFLTFAVLSSICLVLIYYYLPETKDKTLQEISDCITGVRNMDEGKELLPVGQNITIVPSNARIAS